MRHKKHIKEFSNDGLNYLATLDIAGDFSFELRSGSTPKGPSHITDYKDLYDDYSDYGDLDLNRTAMAVYNKAGKILIEWIKTYRPWKITFSATTSRKIRIYRWFADRLTGRIDGYSMAEYPAGVFSFYLIDE